MGCGVDVSSTYAWGWFGKTTAQASKPTPKRMRPRVRPVPLPRWKPRGSLRIPRPLEGATNNTTGSNPSAPPLALVLDAGYIARTMSQRETDNCRSERSALPYVSPLPAEAGARRRVRVLRVAAYVAVAAALIVPIVGFQRSTLRTLRKAGEFDAANPDWNTAIGRAEGTRRPAADKGAIGRWRKAVRQFWAGRNIYDKPPIDYATVNTQPVSSVESPPDWGVVFMHPNTPFVVLLLTPFAYLPVGAMALSYNIAKLLALVAGLLAAAAVAGHGKRRVVDWVVGLGLLWAILPVIGDVQHGNTNVFAMAAVAVHLWLYRKGRDWLAGLPLAAAICLKMTPALFLVYWLYQRSWKTLAGSLGWLVLLAVVIPAAAVGPSRYATLSTTWFNNMIRPGLVRGSWYPEHVNQSLSGVVSRYFQDGQNGDIYWGPDDDPHYLSPRHGWITVAALPTPAAKGLLRAGQLAIAALLAWAIGWRKLRRDDGRRALHYALVLLAMMLLNQRTWQHHAAVLLPAGVAIWQGIAFGRVSRRARAWALGLVAASGAFIWVVRGGLFTGLARLMGRTEPVAETWSDVAKAYGPIFCYFALLFAAAVILSVSLRRAKDPYALQRQKLGSSPATETLDVHHSAQVFDATGGCAFSCGTYSAFGKSIRGRSFINCVMGSKVFRIAR